MRTCVLSTLDTAPLVTPSGRFDIVQFASVSEAANCPPDIVTIMNALFSDPSVPLPLNDRLSASLLAATVNVSVVMILLPTLTSEPATVIPNALLLSKSAPPYARVSAQCVESVKLTPDTVNGAPVTVKFDALNTLSVKVVASSARLTVAPLMLLSVRAPEVRDAEGAV